MGNDFRQISDDKLSMAGASAAQVLRTSTDYPVDPARVQILADAAEEFRERLEAAKEAHNAAMAATRIKDAAAETLVRLLNGIAHDLYRDESVTAGQLSGLGLAPRPSRDSRAKGAKTVTGLRATPAVDGSVRLA